MAIYRLTPAAESDLKTIIRRTIDNWGEHQARNYAQKLESMFVRIANNEVIPKVFSKRFPQLKCSKCEHHYVFYLHDSNNQPTIIAILYEHMDMIKRISQRLN